jgi:hypothetical protein
MDRASCLNLNTRPFKHRSPSRIQIIARPQAWSQKRVAPGDPIELTNATEASSLTPQAAAEVPLSTDAASSVAPRGCRRLLLASRVPSEVCQKFLLRSPTHLIKFHSGQARDGRAAVCMFIQDRVARLENWCRLRRGCFLGGLRRAVLPSHHSTLPAWRAGKQASERGASDRGRTLSERCLETCVMSVLGLYSKFAMQICNTTHFDNEGAAQHALTWITSLRRSPPKRAMAETSAPNRELPWVEK